ncbi:MAG: CsgG/HfaB family protein [Desulfobulbaceae bacterium]
MKNLLILVTAVFILCGCGGKQPESAIFTREGLDLAYVTKVAVLPFENLTADEFVGRRVRDIAFTEILASKKFEVVDKGVVDAVLREMAISGTEALDAPVLKILGKRLGVNAFLSGTVNNIEGGGGALSYPEVSITMHLIDSETAQVLWRSTAYRNGYSVMNRMFDLDPQDEFEVTLSLLKDMISSIPK